MIFKEKTKSIPISKQMVWTAYKLVKANKGSSGVDMQSIAKFDKNRAKELYKIWNRMSSGSYFASAVKRVNIPKGSGKLRPLGIPTVSDRIAQQVVKTYLEPRLESIFLDSSYGYRPNKSAHEAVKSVQSNVLKHSWVIDLDIQEFFENVNHELLFKALSVHVSEKWVLMYIKRWLEAPIKLEDGKLQYPQGKGTPQGGVISPLLSNLYLHYCIDKWMAIHFPAIKMVRYADDMIVHCDTEKEAKELLTKIICRFKECGLRVHPEKTRIVYCKKDKRPLKRKPVQFDFLGFSFLPVMTRLKRGGCFLQYSCKMSRKSKKRILQELQSTELHRRIQSNIQDLAKVLKPKIRGWINYYGKIRRDSLKPIFYYLHHRMIKWILKKYKRFKSSRKRAVAWLRRITNDYPNLFYHWTLGYKLT